MIYRNTPLDDNLLSLIQLLQGRAARSDFPMSYAAKVKYGIASGRSLHPPVQRQDKNERAPTHDYKLNQNVMYLDPVSKKWFPATIVSLMDAKRSYLMVLNTEKHNSTSSHTNKEKLVYHQKSQRLKILYRVDPNMTPNHQTNLTCKLHEVKNSNCLMDYEYRLWIVP